MAKASALAEKLFNRLTVDDDLGSQPILDDMISMLASVAKACPSDDDPLRWKSTLEDKKVSIQSSSRDIKIMETIRKYATKQDAETALELQVVLKQASEGTKLESEDIQEELRNLFEASLAGSRTSEDTFHSLWVREGSKMSFLRDLMIHIDGDPKVRASAIMKVISATSDVRDAMEAVSALPDPSNTTDSKERDKVISRFTRVLHSAKQIKKPPTSDNLFTSLHNYCMSEVEQTATAFKDFAQRAIQCFEKAVDAARGPLEGILEGKYVHEWNEELRSKETPADAVELSSRTLALLDADELDKTTQHFMKAQSSVLLAFPKNK